MDRLYIEPKQDKVLEVLAPKRGLSKAEIIRLGIDKYLDELPVEDDPARGIIGLGKSGKGDLSESHDAYLVMLLNKKKRRNKHFQTMGFITLP
jgi:hypothetical protein